jgi:hypothetical protein
MRPLEARLLLARGRLLERLEKRTDACDLIAEAAAQFEALDMPELIAACRG